jgi:NAD(P)-dependent dehydrogenase (short-subunit alcohol dehydrogenase family)
MLKGNILIIGANRGLGLGFVTELLKIPEINIFATYRNAETSKELFELSKKHNQLKIHSVDITNDADIKNFKKELSGIAIDYLIINAGIFNDTEATIKLVTPSNLMKLFKINSIGSIMILQALLDNVIAGDKKVVMSISSKAGSISSYEKCRRFSYRASKAALNSLMRNASLELEEMGIKILIMSPGWVKTDMGGQNALLEIQESVGGMINVLENEKSLKTGSFLDYQGNNVPW